MTKRGSIMEPVEADCTKKWWQPNSSENAECKKAGQGQLKPQQSHLLAIHHDDLRSGLRVADGPGLYRACGEMHWTAARSDRLEEPVVTGQNRSLVIRGKLLGQELTHSFTLPKDKRLLRPSGRNQHLPRVRCVPGTGGGKEQWADRWIGR